MMKCPRSSSFSLLNFFLCSSFLFFSFCTKDWPFTELTSNQRNSEKPSLRWGFFYHGVARWSCRKFLSKFFNQISEHFHVYHRLHWADLWSDPCIIGKTFSFCRTSVEMSILVKADDVRSGTKASKDHEIHQVWLSESCFQSNKLNRFHLPSSTLNFDIAYWAVNLSLFLRT